MTRDTHGHRLAEWAELVGGSVPDSVGDDGDSATDERSVTDTERR